MARQITLQDEISRDYWTLPQAAVHWQRNKSYLASLARGGNFPGSFQVGDGKTAVWLIPKSALNKWAAENGWRPPVQTRAPQ